MQHKSNDIWTVKYRPRSLAEMVGNERTIDLLTRLVNSNNLPHFIFHGPVGSGKSSAAFCLANDLYDDNYTRNFTYFNASDFFTMGKRYIVRDKRFKRIIGTDDPKKVRESVISIFKRILNEYSSMSPIDHDYKLIFIDSAESFDSSSQHALRRIMEKYTATTRFILSTTQPSKLISPLRSRGLQVYFTYVAQNEFIDYMQQIVNHEELVTEEDALDALYYDSKGNIEKGLYTLQLAITLTNSNKVTSESIYEAIVSQIHEGIIPLFESAIDGDIVNSRKLIDKLIIEDGMSGVEIIELLHKAIIESNEPESKVIHLIKLIAEIEHKMLHSANDRIQLEHMVSRF